MRDLKKMVENCAIVSGAVPVVLNGAANTGDWVSMKNYGHLTVIFYKDSGTAGSDPTLTLSQATVVAGTDTKALTFAELWIKRGSTAAAGGLAALTAITDIFTRTTSSGTNTHTDATSAEDEALWVVEIDADMLDVDNGFDCVQASVADVSDATALGCILYILSQPRYARELVPSPIVD